MITLFDNPFSPFARKVRMVLDYKALAFESVDALAHDQHEGLRAVNPRAEVPVLVEDGLVVRGSSDIVAYLEDRCPQPAVFPARPALRAQARALERLADTTVDAIVHDISLWMWPTHQRSDFPPAGLIEAGHRDLLRVADMLEEALAGAGFFCGELSIADLALFPHVSSFRPLGVDLNASTRPRLHEWNRRMRALEPVRKDLDYVKRMSVEKFVDCPSPYEGEKVVWRGDRIEWLLANGQQEWLMREIDSGRAVIPSSL